ncbi:MAG: hypothetical protein DCO96_14750 [Fluviicola sp. XM-24bin1]|nr:MAG: hypothetical protein DCO96_14750 [Fluviicola sp. XM-24bin1]
MTRISEGIVNNFLIPGVFLLIAGLVCVVIGVNGSSITLIVGLVIFAVAILLFSASSGLEIDEETSRYRKYGKFGPLVLGEWKNLPQSVEIRIQIHTETASRGGVGALPMPEHKTKSLTYDVIAIDTLDNHVHIFGFFKYADAKTAGKVISEAMEVPLRNKVAEKLAENRARRR